MGHHCHQHHVCEVSPAGAYKRALVVALLLNLSMFVTEMYFGEVSESLTLWADSMDFLSDTFSYGSSLLLIGASLRLKGRFAQIKALSMAVLAIGILVLAVSRFVGGAQSVEAYTMGWVGGLALIANSVSLFLLYKTRPADSDSTAIWECTKNDVRSNLILLLSATLILGTSWYWIDLVSACMIVAFSFQSIRIIFMHAKEDIKSSKAL